MVRDELSVLSAFLAVAEERSFTRAAKRLNVSKSGLSHAIRRLEDEIGVRLLARTTRSVSPTDAGEQLLASLRPALADIRGKLTQISGLQQRPVGRVRLLVPRLAAKAVVGPKLGQFVQSYPDVVLDITTDDSHVDLVAAGYDAGIQFGEYIAQDMVAVRVSPDIRPAVVASPGYFRAHGKPHRPATSCATAASTSRHRGEGVYRWELDRGDQSVAVAVNGSLILDDLDLVIEAAIGGAGIAFMARIARSLSRERRTERVLEDWSPPFRLLLYYPVGDSYRR
jgi:DNA-binding transcriptional LysR family regulator